MFALSVPHPLVASPAAIRVSELLTCQLRATQVGGAAAALTVAGCLGVASVSSVFGVLDNTADELADIFGVDDVPPIAASAVRALKPVYAPLKAVSPSCTDAIFPEFNDMLDMNDCLLLPSRVFWSRSGGGSPITIQQTMTASSMWQVSTGSTVWGGGVVLQRYLESLPPDFWQGKRVIELGTGTGLGGVTAARLGADFTLVTDRDAEVLKLAQANAVVNLGSSRASSVFGTSLLDWGPAPSDGSAVEAAYEQSWDLVVGADLTYNREAWPVLVQTIKRLDAPVILSASERRTDELKRLKQFLTDEGLRFQVLDSPMSEGYAKENVKVFRIDRPEAGRDTQQPATSTRTAQPVPPPPPPLPPAVATAAPRPSVADQMLMGSKEADAPPTARELAGELLRSAFNTDSQAWYQVDAKLKAARLDWAYGAVRASGFDPRTPPPPPSALQLAP